MDEETETFVLIVSNNSEIQGSVDVNHFDVDEEDVHNLNSNDSSLLYKNLVVKNDEFSDNFEVKEELEEFAHETNEFSCFLVESHTENSYTELNGEADGFEKLLSVPGLEGYTKDDVDSKAFLKAEGNKLPSNQKNISLRDNQEKYVPETKTRKKLAKDLVIVSGHYSFIKELRHNFPELKDEELLVSTLANIMREIKPPTPPEGFCVDNGSKLECTYCGQLSPSPGFAQRHFQEKHGTRYLQCFACGFPFRSLNILYKHEKQCPYEDAVIVLKARALTVGAYGRPAKNRPFLDEKKRMEERKQALQEREMERRKKCMQWLCNQCPEVFTSKRWLDAHTRKHAVGTRFHCEYCPASYTTKVCLKRHVGAAHLSVVFTCDDCRKDFRRRHCLIAHLRTHLPEKKYPCKVCGKRYPKQEELDSHYAIKHLNQSKPFPCHLCPRSFTRLSSLNYHMKKHGLKIVTPKSLINKLPSLTEEELKDITLVIDPSTKKKSSEEVKSEPSS